MRVPGDETDDDRVLREWFSQQSRGNLDRIESGATTLIQLIVGLYGVLFAVLALSNQPVYLQQISVRIAGTLGVICFFLALLCAMFVVLPRRIRYQRDNLSAMERAYQGLLRRKSVFLQLALIMFLIGTTCLGTVIAAILWNF